ncbi:hypothetical protein PTTG_29141 [Puccinia triticina 1-1 BBBD Race 1]|uniref:Uncharacterized protein n=1 Tax=Puccinia triticina (isolate 1-1 / race 1 (BBBD)) TaxID=630390 RepID=A0A180G642_PUCT1|nr:hypothetical protein PTTG_29141 [Puccinia triticina 1-1 BBBD Race 1]
MAQCNLGVGRHNTGFARYKPAPDLTPRKKAHRSLVSLTYLFILIFSSHISDESFNQHGWLKAPRAPLLKPNDRARSLPASVGADLLRNLTCVRIRSRVPRIQPGPLQPCQPQTLRPWSLDLKTLPATTHRTMYLWTSILPEPALQGLLS